MVELDIGTMQVACRMKNECSREDRVDGTPIDLEKMRSIGVVSRRTRNRVVEGHTEQGERFKATTDELNHTVTERSSSISGVSERQDVHLRPETVHWKLGEA